MNSELTRVYKTSLIALQLSPTQFLHIHLKMHTVWMHLDQNESGHSGHASPMIDLQRLHLQKARQQLTSN